MAYANNYDLPTQVKQALLSDDAQTLWRESYNRCNPQNDDEAFDAWQKAWWACRDHPSSFSFHAIASVEDFDKDNEIIDIDTLHRSMNRYFKSGAPLQYNHSNYQVGLAWKCEPFTKDGMKGLTIWGNLFGGDDGIYDKVRGMFVKGVNSLSVAGESGSKTYVCNEHACGFKRSVSELLEISICKTPANKHAVLISYNDKAANTFAKSADTDTILKFSQLEVHRDESWCPILKLRKSLRESGIDAHAREDGVFIPMDSTTFSKSVPVMRQAGLCVEWTDGGALVKDQDSVLEGLFKEGFAKGSVDADGVVDTSDYLFFAKACDMGLIERRNGKYCLIDPTVDFSKGEKEPVIHDIKGDDRRSPMDARKEGNHTLDDWLKPKDRARVTASQRNHTNKLVRDELDEKKKNEDEGQ